MGVKLRYLDNELLLDEFDVEGIPLSFNLPSTLVPGSDGEVPPVSSEVTLGARNIRLYATLWSNNRQTRLQRLESLAKFLRLYGPYGFDLFPDASSNKHFKRVYSSELTDILLKPLPGLVSDTIALFKATDPYLYTSKQDYSISTLGSGTSFVVNNQGHYPVRAKVTIICTTSPLITPSLNLNSNLNISFNGTLALNDTLELFENLTAKKNTSGVLASMSEDFLKYGVLLLPGNNTITYQDDTTSSHKSNILLEWYPKTLY